MNMIELVGLYLAGCVVAYLMALKFIASYQEEREFDDREPAEISKARLIVFVLLSWCGVFFSVLSGESFPGRMFDRHA